MFGNLLISHQFMRANYILISNLWCILMTLFTKWVETCHCASSANTLWLTTKHFVLELLSTFNVWLVIYQTLMNVIKKNWAHVFDSFSPINVGKKCIFVCNFYLIKIPLLPSYTHVYVHDVMATITNKHNWSKKGHVFFSQDNDKSCKSFLKQYSSKKRIFIPGNRICTQLRILPLSQSKSAPRNQFSG